jgi:hypothetical protein
LTVTRNTRNILADDVDFNESILTYSLRNFPVFSLSKIRVDFKTLLSVYSQNERGMYPTVGDSVLS